MKVANGKEMRALDRKAIEDYGIPGLVLMENAALGVVRAMEGRYGSMEKKRVLIACGKGNNGGDGLAVARHLTNRGAVASVFLVDSPDALTGDAAANYQICRRMDIPIRQLAGARQLGPFSSAIGKADVVVDALLGTGIVPPVRGMVARVVEKINVGAAPVVAVDMPTGLSADSSEVSGAVVQADLTVTFGLPKISLVQYPSLLNAGEVEVIDISLPADLVNQADIPLSLIGASILERLPERRPDLHKGSAGKVLVVGGCQGMSGAVIMAAMASLRVGAGLVYGAVPAAVRRSFHQRLMEGITVPLPESEQDRLSLASLSWLIQASRGKKVAALGPGIGLDRETGEMIRSLIPKLRVPLVLDADGISQISGDPGVLRKAKIPVILTPHPGEMARLTEVSQEWLTTRRVDVARAFAADYRVIVVLKGARTVVAEPQGQAWINTTGNPGMATAGTGDVLTGMIAGLVAQGMKPLEAALSGVYLHGTCGDRAARRRGERGLLARDLLHELPKVLMEV
ncbi:MAG: NAD(P)H-hydrate dehydratase [bacterium]|nr:NAD(P)H-hydrate dehydratase [bacterium]